jgi:hypothetical protein
MTAVPRHVSESRITHPRIVCLLDSDSEYGPYLFVLTDPDMHLDAAAKALGDVVNKVKEDYEDEGWQWDHLEQGIKAAGLPLESAATSTVENADW